jgi:hypothetical protein
LRAATLSGAELLGMSEWIGSAEAGTLADLVIMPKNPLASFRALVGMGTIRLDDATRTVARVGGVHYTIHDGIVYDDQVLLPISCGCSARPDSRFEGAELAWAPGANATPALCQAQRLARTGATTSTRRIARSLNLS